MFSLFPVKNKEFPRLTVTSCKHLQCALYMHAFVMDNRQL